MSSVDKKMLTLLSVMMLMVGCAGAKPVAAPAPPQAAGPTELNSAPQPAPPTPPARPVRPGEGSHGPVTPPYTEEALTAAGSPIGLKPAELGPWLTRAANLGQGPLLPWLQALDAYWYPGKHPGPLEADLNGDGTPEVVTAMNGAPGDKTGSGGIFVVYRKDQAYAVDAELNPEDDTSTMVILHQVADLTGDGLPEVIWSTQGHGAHTSYGTARVSAWQPGRLAALPSDHMYISFIQVQVESRDLLLSGGGVGSAGAGIVQRSWTDRYRWVDGAFRLVDRVYSPSEYGYHRLLDGLTAQTFQRLADARQAYADAMEPQRTVLMPDALMPPQTATTEELADAVHAFARFRLSLLLLADPATALEGRGLAAGGTGRFAGLPGVLLDSPDGTRAPDGAAPFDRATACGRASDWAVAHPAFLEALNSPLGYANPHWKPADLCGGVPPHSV